MRVHDRKRRPDGEDAALTLRYGEMGPKSTVRVSKGELTEKILAIFDGNQDVCSGKFPLNSCCDLTGISRAKVINIEHFRKKEEFLRRRPRNSIRDEGWKDSTGPTGRSYVPRGFWFDARRG